MRSNRSTDLFFFFFRDHYDFERKIVKFKINQNEELFLFSLLLWPKEVQKKSIHGSLLEKFGDH